ncbi:MAG: ATP-binding protein [Planctomycetota bacterium]
MRRSRFLWKLYAGYAVLILTTAALVGVLVGRSVVDSAEKQAHNELLARARALVADDRMIGWFRADPDKHIQQWFGEQGVATGTRLTAIRADGLVLADSDFNPHQMEDHGTRPEFLAAQSAPVGYNKRRSVTSQIDTMYVAVPVLAGTEFLGVARAAYPLDTVESELAEIRAQVVLGATAAAVVALVLAFVVARRTTRPLVEITSVADAIARGDYRRRAAKTAGDEIGQLATSFNSMAQQLLDRVDTISRDRERLVAILGGMVEGVVATDVNELVTHMNDVAGRILGVSPAQSIGRPIYEVTRSAEISETLGRALHDRDREAAEMVRVGPHEDEVVELRVAPLRGAGGVVDGAIVMLHNVTELRRLERIRQDFVANVSHELKTPITAIRGMAETLVEDADMPIATRERFVEKIKDQSLRLSSLVSDLLTMGRLESEGSLVRIEPVDLARVVDSATTAVAPVADKRRTRVSVDVPGEAVEVLGDQDALEQMLTNLLSNAVKYTPAGGEVWVRLGRSAEVAVLEVRDSGVGIEPIHQKRIFERFYRVDKARSRELGGTGLGLAIVKHISLAHGGDVSFESTPGRGTVFRVRLPLATEDDVA